MTVDDGSTIIGWIHDGWMVDSETLAFFWRDAVHHHVLLTVYFLMEVVGYRSA